MLRGLLRSTGSPDRSYPSATLRGGTGKTPVVALACRISPGEGGNGLRSFPRLWRECAGCYPYCLRWGNRLPLSRGRGDEPVLLARTVPGLMVVIGADRYKAGLHAIKELNPDMFILMTGFSISGSTGI